MIAGDRIVAVNGICSYDTDAHTLTQEELKKMVGKTTSFVVKRGYMLQFFDLNVTTSSPSGLKIAPGKQFDNWIEKMPRVALVKKVQNNSPAEIANIREGDEILWCNNVYSKTPDSFNALLTQIKNHKDKKLMFYIKRYSQVESVVVELKEWSGKGLTGMTIVP